MKIFDPIKKISLVSAFTFIPLQLDSALYTKTQTQDEFIYVDTTRVVPAGGTTNFEVLKNAPSADIYVETELKKATIVIDLNKNVLYKYDKTGKATNAYLVASGKKNTPTDTGIRIVSHVETYPYRTAPRNTKRRRNPKDYGPNIIILNKLNTTNGVQSSCGEFIHGNRNPKSIGKYASKGCIRMDNSVIKELSKQVKRGDLIKIIK